jgi:multidrug efflux system outer membrane protein
MRRSSIALVASLCVGLLSGCDLAPVYEPPQFILPESYQGSGPFRVAHPEEALSPRGDWWTLLGDEQLNQFENQLGRANPTLQAAADAYAQARSLAAESQSALSPQLNASAGVSENKSSVNRLFRSPTSPGPIREASNQIGAAASWEPDFWHSLRNGAHAQKRLAQASAADLATARLSLQAELANDYIAVRGLDAQLEVLRQSIVSYQAAVDVARLRTSGQIASGLDLARALSQLDSAQAQETESRLQRDLMQHAVAVLIGAVPSTFSIAPISELRLTPPQLPAGLPSELLQRRPDIASAERQMAAANASIGVSRAAFYPNVTFNLTGGFQDSGFNLLSLPNSLWSVGAGAVMPLFDGGLRRAQLRHSWAQYAQTRDMYRAIVLAAFQEVEDGLSQTQRLATEDTQEREASDQAAQALSISTLLYKDGLDNYLSVSVAQVQTLTAQLAEVQIRIRQIQAAVSLIRALGGGWTVQELPDEKQTLRFTESDYSVSLSAGEGVSPSAGEHFR